MSLYHYKAREVDRATYDALELGDEYEGGTVVDGLCDGERNMLLIVTRYEIVTGLFCVAELPAGWSTKFVGCSVIACHQDHKPKFALLRDLPKPFEDWEEVPF